MYACQEKVGRPVEVPTKKDLCLTEKLKLRLEIWYVETSHTNKAVCKVWLKPDKRFKRSKSISEGDQRGLFGNRLSSRVPSATNQGTLRPGTSGNHPLLGVCRCFSEFERPATVNLTKSEQDWRTAKEAKRSSYLVGLYS